MENLVLEILLGSKYRNKCNKSLIKAMMKQKIYKLDIEIVFLETRKYK